MASNESDKSYLNCVRQLASIVQGLSVKIDTKELSIEVDNDVSKLFEDFFIALVAL